MEQHTDGQYDDDLTVGVDDFENDSIETEYVDLFEFSGGEESPISRLKTIMLEIDWEITDEVLNQFNDELIDLMDIWSDDPIKLVYVQALQKICKYIYQKKSDSHPSAIKLLMSYYYNLEKITIDTDLGEDEKKSILKADLLQFEKLKRKIDPIVSSPSPQKAVASEEDAIPSVTISEKGAPDPVLFNLKACILGMDWEISERELGDLSREVKKLETEFAGNKARMLFLQGIEGLGGYIKLKKSDSHADAFKLLYSFYEGLEKIVVNDLGIEDAKAILLPEVEKFNSFKKVIAPTITQDAISEQSISEGAAEYSPATDSSVAPAFSEFADEEGHGFQAEDEVADLGKDAPDEVLDQLDTFFTGDDEEETLDSPDKTLRDSDVGVSEITAEEALRGVDVETEADDDSDEDALPTEAGGILAPALSDAEEEEGSSAKLTDTELTAESDGVTTAEIESRLSGFFDDDPADRRQKADGAIALEGVNVETEADDDSAEEALPTVADGVLAPALSDFGEEQGFTAESEGKPSGEMQEKLDGFFGDESVPDGQADSGDAALAGVAVETEADDESGEEALPVEDDGLLAPALADFDEEPGFSADDDATKESADDAQAESEADIEARLGGFFGETPASASDDEEISVAALEGVDVEADGEDVSAEEPLPIEEDDIFASALPETDSELTFTDDESLAAEQEDGLEGFPEVDTSSAAQEEERLIPLPGIDVETEADDDSDEEALPLETTGTVAPAFSDMEEGGLFSDFSDTEFSTDDPEVSGTDIEQRLSQFFDDEPPGTAEVKDPLEGDGESDPVSDSDFEAGAVPEMLDTPDVSEISELPPSSIDLIANEKIAEPPIGEDDFMPGLVEDVPIETELESFFDGMEETEPAETTSELSEGADSEPGLSADEDKGEQDDGIIIETEADDSETLVEFSDETDGEVLFEPVPESEADEAHLENIPVASLVEDEETAPETYATFESESDEQDFFAEIDEKVDDPGEFKQEILEEVYELAPRTRTFPDEPAEKEEFQFEDATDESGVSLFDSEGDEVDETIIAEEEFIFASDDLLSDLRTSIASLGIEINDRIIQAILSDVNSLRQRFMTLPVEKTLLQLISTIVEHIGHYGYESSAEAHGLLLAVFEKLNQIQDPDVDSVEAQEILLAETCNVLLWQQKMLDRQAIKKGDQLTFLDPVRSEANEEGDLPESSEDSSAELESDPTVVDSDEADSEALGEEFNALFEPDEAQESADFEEGASEPDQPADIDDSLFDEVEESAAVLEPEADADLDPVAASFIKKEIASLKESLRSEIDELRNRLQDKS